MLAAIGMGAFRERARRELLATGEKARTRSAGTRDQLTPQEEQIARLARNDLIAQLSDVHVGGSRYSEVLLRTAIPGGDSMSLGSYPRDWPADLSARESDPFVRAPREGVPGQRTAAPPDS